MERDDPKSIPHRSSKALVRAYLLLKKLLLVAVLLLLLLLLLRLLSNLSLAISL